MQQKSSTLEKLAVFAGTWKGTGQFLEGAGPGAGASLKTHHHYEWLPGGYFVVYQGYLDFGAGKLEAHRVIGYDEATKLFTMYAVDSLGYARTYEGKVDGDVWHFNGKNERVTFTFSDDNKHMATYWENSEDGKSWTPLCKTEETKE